MTIPPIERFNAEPAELGERIAEALMVALAIAGIVCVCFTWFN